MTMGDFCGGPHTQQEERTHLQPWQWVRGGRDSHLGGCYPSTGAGWRLNLWDYVTRMHMATFVAVIFLRSSSQTSVCTAIVHFVLNGMVDRCCLTDCTGTAPESFLIQLPRRSFSRSIYPLWTSLCNMQLQSSLTPPPLPLLMHQD